MMSYMPCGKCGHPMFVNDGETEITCPGCRLVWHDQGTHWRGTDASPSPDDEHVLYCRCKAPAIHPQPEDMFARCPQCRTLFAYEDEQWHIDPPWTLSLLEYALSLPNDEETLNQLLDALSAYKKEERTHE